MRLPSIVTHRLLDRLLRMVERRLQPDRIIGGVESPYLMRWHVIPRNRWCNVYFHWFLRSDDDRALHDHPWVNVSIILSGRYLEHRRGRPAVMRESGQVVARLPTSAHRIELVAGPVWTLFLTGPFRREWGFHCPQGWRHWRDFTSGANGERVGKGCD